MNTVERFSNRVANYVKYRPGYPAEVIQFFKDRLGITDDSVIADIGSGTGLSAKVFLENGNTVYGVEPNAAMRDAAQVYLKTFHISRTSMALPRRRHCRTLLSITLSLHRRFIV